MSGFTVSSTNATGTTFTVQDIGTAFQIAGGAGQDTIAALGFAFTPDQRSAIFATASIEQIVDASGTYAAPPQDPSTYTLTTGPDTIVGGASDDTVTGTATTLNAGDQLTGGAGIDELALYGSGLYQVDQLATFTGFESISLNNFTSGSAVLYLGSQSIAVTAYGSGSEVLYLGSGAITFGGSGLKDVRSTSPSNWNAENSIDGDHLHLNYSGSFGNAFYDLTTNTLTNISYLFGYGSNLTLKINSADAAGVSNFYGYGTNSQLVTSDAALDLSHSKVSGFTVSSTNATGTTFTVQDIGTAFQIAGGAGQDTIAALGFAFTPDQRSAIFATNSIETIQDQSGTYFSTGGANVVPTLALENKTTSLPENIATTNRVKVADITITDDGEGSNDLTLSGDDATLFEVFDGDLYLKAGTVLNFEGGNTTLDVTVAVDDAGVGGTPDDSESLSISVTNVNEAPTGAPTAVLTNGTEDVAYTVAASTLLLGFSDPDGDPLSLANLAASSGSVVDNGNGTFTITQAANFNGAVTLTYNVTDGHGGTLTGQTRGYTVTAVNDAPVITSDGGGNTAAKSVPEHTTLVTTLVATDPDITQTLTFSINALAGLFELRNGNELHFITAPDWESLSALRYTVTVQVSDGNGGTDTQTIIVDVTDVKEPITNGEAGGTLAGTPGDDLIDGQGGNDTINAGAGNDTITGGAGRDVVNAGDGDDIIVATIGDGTSDAYNGGSGSDTIDMSGITAAATINLAQSTTSSSQTGQDTLSSIENAIGGSGNDTITGNGGDNRLDGGGGADTINAGSGDDIVIGGAGNDTMNGQGGNDIFVFAAGFGNDKILQFDANPAGGQDLLDISTFGITGATFAARVTIAGDGADTLITIDGNAAQTIRLIGIEARGVSEADFVHL